MRGIATNRYADRTCAQRQYQTVVAEITFIGMHHSRRRINLMDEVLAMSVTFCVSAILAAGVVTTCAGVRFCAKAFDSVGLA
jgi:hypothetical protein